MALLTDAEKEIFSQITPILRSYSFGSEAEPFSILSNENELKKIRDGHLFDLPASEAPVVISQACHVVSSYLWLTNQVETLCTGFALIEEECVSSEWYHHSFCLKEEQILEPTPLIRDKYFGFQLDFKESIDLCLDTIEWYDEWKEELNLSVAQIEVFKRYLFLAKGI